METIEIILAIFIAIIVSDILDRMFPKIPLIFFQILIGIGISYLPMFHHFSFHPELFMIIIIKPLIFDEAQSMDLRELRRFFKPIMSLAVFLVIITVLITAGLANLIMPTLPFVVTVVLASVIMPTNTNILEGLIHHKKFPYEILHILEGESLFSDSIAILIYDLALAASIASEFHLAETVLEFLYVIIGGALIGLLLGFLIVNFRIMLTRYNLENIAMLVLIQIVTPILVYEIAEGLFHVSGILAVIMTGIIYRLERSVMNMKSTKLSLIADSTWEVIGYVLNGTVAVMLGLNLPTVLGSIKVRGDVRILQLVMIAMLVYIVVTVLRFFWVRCQPKKFLQGEEAIKQPQLQAILYAFSGVHATITLAIALAIPSEGSGVLSLYRDELIFIATLVILISIIVPAVVLPFLLPDKTKGDSLYNFSEVRIAMIKHTIKEIQNMHIPNAEYGRIVVDKLLNDQLSYLKKGNLTKLDREEVRKILRQTTQVEIDAIQELVADGKISKEVAIFYEGYLMYSNRFDLGTIILKMKIALVKHKLQKSVVSKDFKYSKIQEQFRKELDFAREYSYKAAFNYLDQLCADENVSFAIAFYRKRLGKIIREIDTSDNAESVRVYMTKAFHIEEMFIRDYLDKELISNEVADDLLEQITYDVLICNK